MLYNTSDFLMFLTKESEYYLHLQKPIIRSICFGLYLLLNKKILP